MRAQTAIRAIEEHGLLLVYPLRESRDPPSLWSVAYPRTKMRWEWDDSGDDRVARLWHLREELSKSKKVIYGKWFRGRATFFSRDCFCALLALRRRSATALSRDARALLMLLEESSPRSTKEIKRETGLQGRLLESTYQRALKELWSRLLVVGFGEVDEGAFPSLAIGATRWLFEDLWLEAEAMSEAQAKEALAPLFTASPAVKKFLDRLP